MRQRQSDTCTHLFHRISRSTVQAIVALCKCFAELLPTPVVTATTLVHASAKHRQGANFNIPPSEIFRPLVTRRFPWKPICVEIMNGFKWLICV